MYNNYLKPFLYKKQGIGHLFFRESLTGANTSPLWNYVPE